MPRTRTTKTLAHPCGSSLRHLRQHWDARRRNDELIHILGANAHTIHDIYNVVTEVAVNGWQQLCSVLTADSNYTAGYAPLHELKQKIEHNSLTRLRVSLETNTSTARHGGWNPPTVPITAHQRAILHQAMDDLSGKLLAMRSTSRQASDGEQEERRSLNRIAYMGGLLLPFSIVAGVFSMGSDFGPGGHLFFIYWATSVPVVIFTLVLIYADGIRKRYVWQQPTGGTARFAGTLAGRERSVAFTHISSALDAVI